MNRLALVCRLLLGATFCWAGAAKIGDPAAFATQLAAYHVVPPSWLSLLALALPEIELLAGLCLVAGFLAESSALVLGLLSVVFAGAVTLALGLGLDIECGCFAGNTHVHWTHALLNLGLAALALVVLRLGPGAGALDDALAAYQPQ